MQSFQIHSGTYKKSARHSNHGFTLIEVMIVVAIIAILAAIAYPSYESSIRRTNQRTAASCLSEYASALERVYSTNMTYAPTSATGGPAPINLACANELGNAPGGRNRYTVTITARTANAFVVTATPIGAQTADTQCRTLAINQLGQRASSWTTPTTNTWTDPNNCW